MWSKLFEKWFVRRELPENRCAKVLNNFVTKERARVKSDKSTSPDKLEELLGTVHATLKSKESYMAKADLNGIIVQFMGNSFHQYDFWSENWWLVDDDVPAHAFIYSVNGVKEMEPMAYYCPERYTAVFINTEYYGQCKSWALGAAAHILEENYNTHSIHGACIDVNGQGIIVVAPTGTGKTTQAFKLLLRPEGKLIGDDWVYIRYPEKESKNPKFPLIGTQPERSLYMRTENEEEASWLRYVFDICKTENVVTRKEDCENTACLEKVKKGERKCVFDEGFRWCYFSFPNARAMVLRERLLGPKKVANKTKISLLILLERVPGNPPEVKLSRDKAIEVLRKGEYMIRPGAGPKEMWGKIGSEPYYNPYLLKLNHEKQEYFFLRLIEEYKVPCILLNTASETIEQTHNRIMSALKNRVNSS